MEGKNTRRKLPDDLMQQRTGGLTNRIERLDRRLEKLDLSFRRKKAEKDFEVRHDHPSRTHSKVYFLFKVFWPSNCIADESYCGLAIFSDLL